MKCPICQKDFISDEKGLCVLYRNMRHKDGLVYFTFDKDLNNYDSSNITFHKQCFLYIAGKEFFEKYKNK